MPEIALYSQDSGKGVYEYFCLVSSSLMVVITGEKPSRYLVMIVGRESFYAIFFKGLYLKVIEVFAKIIENTFPVEIDIAGSSSIN